MNTQESDKTTQNVIDILTKMREFWNQIGDIYRVKSYDNAIESIRNNTMENIGDRIIKKIEEIVKTGKLAELDEVSNYKLLLNVLGFGKKGIKKMIERGIKISSRADLLTLENKMELTKLQRIGIRYSEQLQRNIPHKVVAEISAKIQKEIDAYCSFYLAAGSFRRDRETSNDLDVLIVGDRASIDAWVFNNTEAILATGEKKISFLYQYDTKKVIQVDFRYVSFDNIAAATLYFTGSKEFNVSMRELAKNYGYKLNEYNLIDMEVEMPLNLVSENDIFDLLDMKFVAPKDRN